MAPSTCILFADRPIMLISRLLAENKVVNQLFGTVMGLGMSAVSFDWNQISWIGSPLMVPWWAEVHIFIGFVLFWWIILPILYYNDVRSSFPFYNLRSDVGSS